MLPQVPRSEIGEEEERGTCSSGFPVRGELACIPAWAADTTTDRASRQGRPGSTWHPAIP